MKNVIIILSTFFILCACQKKTILNLPQYKVYQIEDSDQDIKIPTQVWNNIELGENNKKEENINFEKVSVILSEKTPGVLIYPNIEVQLPKGGGSVDLSQYVIKNQGSFFVSFRLASEDYAQTLKAYFVSQNRKRKIDGEIYGAGCNVFMNIRDYFLKEVTTKGIEVNVTRARHTSVIGGDFVFAFKQNNQTSVSRVSFLDSKNSHLYCTKENI